MVNSHPIDRDMTKIAGAFIKAHSLAPALTHFLTSHRHGINGVQHLGEVNAIGMTQLLPVILADKHHDKRPQSELQLFTQLSRDIGEALRVGRSDRP